MIFKLIAAILFAYFVGNIHFARLLSKARKDDITKHGSGNPGTMNMLRTHGFIFAIGTLILDALKGAVPALVGFYLLGGTYGGIMAVYSMYLCGFFAVIGHVFPVFYKFKGGKGVATAFGFFTIVNPLLSLILFLLGLILFFTIKIGSVSSLIYVACFVICQIITNLNKEYILPMVLLALSGFLIFYAHKSNLKKIFSKQENKISFTTVVAKDKKLINDTKQEIKQKINNRKNKK